MATGVLSFLVAIPHKSTNNYQSLNCKAFVQQSYAGNFAYAYENRVVDRDKETGNNEFVVNIIIKIL